MAVRDFKLPIRCGFLNSLGVVLGRLSAVKLKKLLHLSSKDYRESYGLFLFLKKGQMVYSLYVSAAKTVRMFRPCLKNAIERSK